MRILAVDDDPSILMLLDHALGMSDHHDVTLAFSAREALDAIERDEVDFDCFLIDIQMPEIDGIHLTQVIRQTPGYERHPILMLTAMHDKSYLDRAFRAGATDYVSKPFDFRELQSRIFDAQGLAVEKARSVCRIDRARNIKWSHGVAGDTGPDQVIDHGGADGLIAYGEFDNYVLELARRPQCNASVVALKIADPTLGHSESSLREFSSMLREVIICINASLPNLMSSISYRGNGTVLCVMDRYLNAPKEMIESEINARFLDISTGANIAKLRVFLGDPVPLKADSDAGVLEVLWQATNSVEKRFVSKKEIATISKRVLNRNLLSDEQHRLERKAYKSVMKDILSDMNDDHWIRKLYNRASR
ncbi:Response regulator receiver domain-containing protein [Roseovarius azorensis]|uniref:Response regulator receiver domain-containing protein n=2 Tax=Roseovarius azorensis TaxID=1287727 RepID=A0A1H7TU28_9RHOB|nr:Response regulator receiver domain-containing protein [Roseovarius azorensis]